MAIIVHVASVPLGRVAARRSDDARLKRKDDERFISGKCAIIVQVISENLLVSKKKSCDKKEKRLSCCIGWIILSVIKFYSKVK